MDTVRIDEMTWAEVQQAIKDGFETIVIAIGSIEQHGPHLPLATDSLIGDHLVNLTVSKMSKSLQGHTISIGCADHHMSFAGTISLKASTLQAIITDYTESLIKHGFKNILFISSHGGNFEPLKEIITELQSKYQEVIIDGCTDLKVYVNKFVELSEAAGVSTEEAGIHAGESETSMVYAISQDAVRKDKIESGFIGTFGKEEINSILENGINAVSKNGILGDPTKASYEKGKKYLELFSDFLADKLTNLLK